MQIVRAVGVLSFAKVFALIHACFGLVFAPLFLLAGIAASIGNGWLLWVLDEEGSLRKSARAGSRDSTTQLHGEVWREPTRVAG